MKKNDWLIVVGGVLYAYLFYKESVGLNLALFSLFLTTTLLVFNPDFWRKKAILIALTGILVTTIGVAYYGNLFTVILNIISLLLLAGLTSSSRASVLMSLLYAVLAQFRSTYDVFKNFLWEKLMNGKMGKTGKSFMLLFPIFTTLLFLFMYGVSNPIFSHFLSMIDLSWVSWGWLLFVVLGMGIVYGAVYVKRINKIGAFDEIAHEEVVKSNLKESWSLFGKLIKPDDEFYTAKMLLLMLNVIILIVNALDFYFLFFSNGLPEGVTYSEYIHQGVGILIISVLLSIGLLLFYFRGHLNFIEKNKSIKVAAYIWIAQNMLMLVSVWIKNNMYVHEYGLTYKRIGVYIYIGLTIIGLFTVFYKIIKMKVNYYLIRLNGWLFYAVFVILCTINWDKVIITTNVKTKNDIDIYYILSLSDTCIDDMVRVKDKIKDSEEKELFQKLLIEKRELFERKQKLKTWKSLKIEEIFVATNRP